MARVHEEKEPVSDPRRLRKRCPICGGALLRMADDLLPGVAPDTIFILHSAGIADSGYYVEDKHHVLPTTAMACERCGYLALFLDPTRAQDAVGQC